MVAVTSLPLSCFILRRRFPWNIILLSIFVSGLGLSRGPGGAPMAPQLPRWAGKDRRTCGQAGSPLSSPFSPVDAGHGADDRHDCQVRPGDPAVIGSGVPPVLHDAASSSERLPGARGCSSPLGSGTAGFLSRTGAVGEGHQQPSGRGMLKCEVTLLSLLCSMYQTKAVLIAMLITAIVAIVVTIFCFQTKARRRTHPALSSEGQVWGHPGLSCDICVCVSPSG